MWKTSAVAIILSMLLVASAVQAIIKFDIEAGEQLISEEGTAPASMGDPSLFEWEDDFKNTNGIDMGLSYNIIVDTNGDGNVYMDNTYNIWYDPAWTCMKPIDIYNSAGGSFEQYILYIIVEHDSDMQWDFDDLRFINENEYELIYKIVDKTNGVSAKILVLVPEIPLGETTIYMFYGNPAAQSASVDTIFTWDEIEHDDPMVGPNEDLKITWTLTTEGAWDPDVEYGSNKFLIAWEEGRWPEWEPDYWHRLRKRQIHGRTYDINGENPYPDYPNDIYISPNSGTLHAENPSMAFGSGKFFVAYEQNPIISRYRIDIKGNLVSPGGTSYTPFTICESYYSFPSWLPCMDPCVAYDSHSGRFMVVWEDYRHGSSDVEVYGKLYTVSGNSAQQVGSEISVATESQFQGQPWVCSDDNGHFLVVYENAPSGTNGPFSLKAKLFTSSGIELEEVSLVTGHTSLDNVYPSVMYNPGTERYCAVWNTADISDQDHNGKIECKLLNEDADPVSEVITIDGSSVGSAYKIANVIPLGLMFFITYDSDYVDLNDIWGRLASSDGVFVSERQQLSDSVDYHRGWNNIAITDTGRIFAAWEDDREYGGVTQDQVRGSVWECSEIPGSSDVDYNFGPEKESTLDAWVVSISITPEDLYEWDEFFADFTMPGGTDIRFHIMDGNGTEIIKEDVSPYGGDISDIQELSIRLNATFTRDMPKYTPYLEWWKVTALVGSDIHPPSTELFIDPEESDGNNGWYVTTPTITLIATDPDTNPENVTTYYRINGGEIQNYTAPFDIEEENSQNYVEYWSVDNAQNNETHKFSNETLPFGYIKYDPTGPIIDIIQPPDQVLAGEVEINGTVSAYISGSELANITIKINGETVLDEEFEGYFTWFEYTFTATIGETYDIKVIAEDEAGHAPWDNRNVSCIEYGIYEPGFLYIFKNPKIPVSILETLELAAAVDYDILYVLLLEYDENATSVEFVARQLILGAEFTCRDNNLTDGCSCNFEFSFPIGFYEIKAHVYEGDTKLEEHLIISKMLVVLL